MRLELPVIAHLLSAGDTTYTVDSKELLVGGDVAEHNIVGSEHTASGLTPDHVLTATGVDSFAFQALPGNFSGLDDPSAQVGLSAVNGTATTAMRSDAAPALDQSITPTWTGSHTFNANVSAGVGVTFDGVDISDHDHSGANQGGTVAHGSLSGVGASDHHSRYTDAEAVSAVSAANEYVKRDGSEELTADWDAGSYQIRAETFRSDVTTGTAPLTVASTTLVTNLNADLLDGNHASAFATSGHNHDHGSLTGLSDDDHTQYFLLAGETTTAELHSGANLEVYSDAGSTLIAAINGSTGNINAGTDRSEGWTASWNIVRVGDQSTIADAPASGAYLSSNLYWDGTDWRYIESDVGAVYDQAGGGFRWRNANSGTAGTIASLTDLMTIDSDGNLSVASDSVTTINAGVSLFASVDPRTEIITGTSSNSYEELIVIRHDGKDADAELRRLGLILKLNDESTTTESNKMGGIVLESSNANANTPDLHLITSDTKRVTVTAAGLVGIATDAPDYALDVAGSIGLDEYLLHNGDPNTYIRYQNDQITLTTGGTDIIDATTTVTFGGNLYMPEYLYHAGDTNTYVRYQTDQISLVAGGVTLADFVEGATDYARFPTYVGINATPSGNVRLDVDGDARVQSGIVIGGTNKTGANAGEIRFDSQAAPNDAGLSYLAQESLSYTNRYALLFDTTNDASYPYLTNRTPSGDVAIFTGSAAGGSENEHFRIEGGDGTVDAYFTDANLAIGLSSPDGIFEIETPTSDYFRINTANGHIQFHNAGSSQHWSFAPRSSGDLSIAVQASDPGSGYIGSGDDVVTISSGGNVDVVGNLDVGGDLDIGGQVDITDQIQLTEMTAPGNPAANDVYVFAQDDGSGNSQLAAKFSDGTVEILGTAGYKASGRLIYMGDGAPSSASYINVGGDVYFASTIFPSADITLRVTCNAPSSEQADVQLYDVTAASQAAVVSTTSTSLVHLSTTATLTHGHYYRLRARSSSGGVFTLLGAYLEW